MSPDFITGLVLEYRYWILIPLTFIEGPVVAFVAGTLAAVGVFNLYFLAVLFFVRDVGMDVACYAIGYFGGSSAFAKRMLVKIGVTEGHLEQVRVHWEKRPGWTMFLGKLSYGIAGAFIVVAGMVKMPFKTFLKYGVLVAILQYGVLLFVGYFFGQSLGGSVTHLLSNLQYAIGGIALAISGYYIFSWYMRQKFLKKEKEIEETSVSR